jgi:predicted RNA-binding protein with PIN domain
MNKWTLIDGYNVIQSWPELKELSKVNLEHARTELFEKMVEYGAFKGEKVVIIYDSTDVEGRSSIEEHKGISVIYTAEKETADSYIERLAHNLVKNGDEVFVVTSDYAEQITVFVFGAYRISSREFRENYLIAKKQIKEHAKKVKSSIGRNELASHLNGEVLAKFEVLRRKK